MLTFKKNLSNFLDLHLNPVAVYPIGTTRLPRFRAPATLIEHSLKFLKGIFCVIFIRILVVFDLVMRNLYPDPRYSAT